jgi:hypothetical protein
LSLDPFLYLSVSVFDDASALGSVAVFIGDLLQHEANFLGEILNSIYPVIENQGRVEGFGLGHPLDEVDG